jgi:hypothetical protein
MATAVRTTDDIARLFAERRPGAHVLWLTAKQGQWLSDQYRRENSRRRNYDGRETPAGQFCPECESVYTTHPPIKGGAVRMQISPCQHRPVGCGDSSCCYCRS